MEKVLTGKIALVAGATRGAGRGIACMLGEAGATVYCTGRSSRESNIPGARPETIEETAEKVSAFGGMGIPVRVDHAQPDEVESLLTRIKKEQGRLDILVNDIWGGDQAIEWGKPFWELSPTQGQALLANAINTHIITSRFAAPLMLETGNGLIVEITDGNSLGYRGNLYYDLVKHSVIRLAFAQAYELRNKNITALALTPGFLRSETMLELFGVTEANWKTGVEKDPNFIASESPYFVGRALAALAIDPNRFRKTGRAFSSWELSDEYGFTDINGERPHWGRHWEKTFGKPIRAFDDNFYRYQEDSPIGVVQPDWP
jgi:NAD(P)-dependent dehydrogenase (short-subunit alcohol dehydrogenase family)